MLTAFVRSGGGFVTIGPVTPRVRSPHCTTSAVLPEGKMTNKRMWPSAKTIARREWDRLDTLQSCPKMRRYSRYISDYQSALLIQLAIPETGYYSGDE